MAFGVGLMAIPILASGRIQRLMGMECMCGRMVIGMKGSGGAA